MELAGLRDLPDPQVLPALPVYKEQLAQLEQPVPKGHKDPQVLKVPRVQLDQPGHKDPQVLRDLQEHKALREQPALKERKVLPALRDQLEQQG
jgi:hypothetical protein